MASPNIIESKDNLHDDYNKETHISPDNHVLKKLQYGRQN